ncbi:MAG TPA: holo-ACP synthase [Armatimonadota bacterium]|nr:holo-ACP synthase [Armatimonadota bacterium]
MIQGIGTDIVEIERVAQAVANPRFRERVFTPAERVYCDDCPSAERYAGRFAAKEAIAKALGAGLCWQDVEILPAPNGAPIAHLHGAAAERLAGGVVHVSISHSRTHAVAFAIAERRGTTGEE